MKNLTAPLLAIVQVFRNPQLGRLQLAWAGISFAMWAFVITLGVYAFGAGGAAAVGIAGLVRLLPGALASPFGGLLGDRHSRRAVLVYSTLASAVALALGAVAVAAGAEPWLVFASAGLFTIFTTPYIPAESALMPKLARSPQELAAANVSHSFMDSFGFLGGSLAAGILVGFTSVELVFALSAAVVLLSTITLLGIEQDKRPEYDDGEDASSLAQETVAGFRSLVADPPVRLLGASTALLYFFEGAADVLMVIIALDLLGLAESSVGFFNVAWAIGALAGGAALAVLVNRGQLVGLFGIQGATLVLAALLPAFAVLRWSRLRSFEIGAPVEEEHFTLLRNDRVFTPLSLATLERLTNDLTEVEVDADVVVITQGEVGDRFYLIESGSVEVSENGVHRRFQGPGESFGEIALLRDSPRTATVRTVEPTRLLALDQDHFIAAVTGHRRTGQVADEVIDARLNGPPAPR